MPNYSKIDKKTIGLIGAVVIAVGAIGWTIISSKTGSGKTDESEPTRMTDTNGNERYANTYCFEFGHETTGQGYMINAHDLEYFAYEGTSYVLCEIEFTNTGTEAMDFDPSESIRLYLDNEQATLIDARTVQDVLEPHLYLTRCTIQPGRRETGYLVWSYYKDFEIIEVCYNEYISFTGEIGDATQLEVPSSMIYDANGNLIDATAAERNFFFVPGSNVYHYCEDQGSNQCIIDYGGQSPVYVTATPQQMHDWGYTPCPDCLPELSSFVIVPEPVETEPPVTEPVWVPLLDEEGNPVYQTDEDGEIIEDEEGNPIPVMVQQ